MINIHSVAFKISATILVLTSSFVVITSVVTTKVVKSTYEYAENEKMAALIEFTLPELSLNVGYGFHQAVNEIVNNISKNSSILYVFVAYGEDQKVVFNRNAKTFDAYMKEKNFCTKKAIIDPATNERIGTLELVYSRSHMDALMQAFYYYLLLGLSIFIVVILVVTYFIYQTIKPIQILSLTMENFDPANPSYEIKPSQRRDEIGVISRAFKKMIESIILHNDQLHMLHKELKGRKQHLQDAQSIAHVGSWEYDPFLKEFHMSEEMYRLLGMEHQSDINWESFHHCICEEDRDYVDDLMLDASKNEKGFDVEIQFKTLHEERIDINMRIRVHQKPDNMRSFTGVCLDITEHNRAKRTIEQLAYYDPLTKLPNRTLFKDRLNQALEGAKRNNKKIAVLFLDLDNFKMINDTLGHDKGDELLMQVAAELQRSLRKVDTICRVGGDEFIILLPMVEEKQNIENVAQKLMEKMKKKWHLANSEFYVSFSMGIAIYPDHANKCDELIKKSDTAMYHAKHLGRNNYQFYKAQLESEVGYQMRLEQAFREAVQTKEGLLLHYQPKIDLMSGEIIGAEALIRWQNSELGLLYPDSFIPLAESTGLIIELGNWIIEECALFLVSLQEMGISDFTVAINLSARQFQSKTLLECITKVLHSTPIKPKQLEFEITETISMSNIEENLIVMKELKKLGVLIAIDDFGTGYSSLSYLKQFPVDTLKIDKSFVLDMVDDSDDEKIVQTVVSMAVALGLKTVAEGVETNQHRKKLIHMACDYAQGYYFSKPVDALSVKKLIAENKTENL